MRFLLVVLAVLSGSAAFAVEPGSIAYLDHKNGFRDMKFGDPVEKLSPRAGGLEKCGGRSVNYFRLGDTLQIGEIKLDSIMYKFLDGKLFQIDGEKYDTSLEQCRSILNAFRRAYGPPKEEKPSKWKGLEATWKGKVVDVRMVHYRDSRRCWFGMGEVRRSAEYNEDCF